MRLEMNKDKDRAEWLILGNVRIFRKNSSELLLLAGPAALIFFTARTNYVACI